MFLAFRKTIGDKMESRDVFKYSLKCSEKVITVWTKTSLNFTGKDDNIDSYLLFQRLVVLAKVSNASFEDCKGYELCISGSCLNQLV